MKIETFQNDINKSQQQCITSCVIARALNRGPMPNGANYVIVDGQQARYVKVINDAYETVAWLYLTPEVKRYIKKFDKDKKLVRPTVMYIPDGNLHLV